MHLVKVLKGIGGVKGICSRLNFTKLAKMIMVKIRSHVALGLIMTYITTMIWFHYQGWSGPGLGMANLLMYGTLHSPPESWPW